MASGARLQPKTSRVILWGKSELSQFSNTDRYNGVWLKTGMHTWFLALLFAGGLGPNVPPSI